MSFYRSSIAVVFCVTFFIIGCAPNVYVKNDVVFASQFLNPVDICKEGLCVLPFWYTKKDTLSDMPDIHELEAMVRRRGHRQLKLIPYKKIYRLMEDKTGRKDLLFLFEKQAFKSLSFKGSGEFWETLGKTYLLRIALHRGDLIRMFNRKRKVDAVLYASLYSAASRKVVWKAMAVCKNTADTEMDSGKIIKAGLVALIEMLPIHPDITYIQQKNEYW